MVTETLKFESWTHVAVKICQFERDVSPVHALALRVDCMVVRVPYSNVLLVTLFCLAYVESSCFDAFSYLFGGFGGQ